MRRRRTHAKDATDDALIDDARRRDRSSTDRFVLRRSREDASRSMGGIRGGVVIVGEEKAAS